MKFQTSLFTRFFNDYNEESDEGVRKEIVSALCEKNMECR